MTSSKPQVITHVSKSVPYTVYDARWVPVSAKCVSVGAYPRETGVIKVWALEGGDLKPLHETEKSSAFKCCTFGASAAEDRRLATGDFEGKLCVWDLEHTEIPLYTAKAHAPMVNSIDAFGDVGAPEVVTGGRDGRVCVWDPRQKGKPVASFEPQKSSSSTTTSPSSTSSSAPQSEGGGVDCWAVRFGNAYNEAERYACAGYDNGDVKMFDLRTNTIHFETNVRNGVCSIDFDRRDIQMNKLLITTLESKFRVYDMRTRHPEKGYSYLVEKAHSSTVWCGRHLPQNRDIFCTTGGNGTFSVHKYMYPPKRSEKDDKGHETGIMGHVATLTSSDVAPQPILSADWNVHKEGLVCVAALDQSVKILLVTKLHKV